MRSESYDSIFSNETPRPPSRSRFGSVAGTEMQCLAFELAEEPKRGVYDKVAC
jgi:hypothetical protein